MTGNYQNNAVHITVYDPSGAPVSPSAQEDLEAYAERVAKHENLIVSVSKT